MSRRFFTLFVCTWLVLAVGVWHFRDYRPPGESWRRKPREERRVSPLEQYLGKIDGVRVLFFTCVGCGPCEKAKREVIPWVVKNNWKVNVIDDETTAELFDVAMFPTWVVIRGHQEVARTTSIKQRDVVAMLQAAKADNVDHLGYALMEHIGRTGPAIMMSPAGGSKPTQTEMPLLGFPLGPAISPLDFLNRFAGQEFAWGPVKIAIPKAMSWKPTRLKDCMHLDIMPPPSLRMFGVEAVTLTGVDVSYQLDRVGLCLDGFPDFPIRFLW